MPQLYDKETGAALGAITQEQLQFLIDHLEEESEEDMDYYIDQGTLEVLEGRGGGRHAAVGVAQGPRCKGGNGDPLVSRLSDMAPRTLKAAGQ